MLRVTQLGVRELLVAPHMLPWSTYPDETDERLDVRNGVCLRAGTMLPLRLTDPPAFYPFLFLLTFPSELRSILT
jgi:hypothetical protein